MVYNTRQMKKIIHPENGTATNLFALPELPTQLQKSIELVQRQNGILTILIHPFFQQLGSQQFDSFSTPQLMKYLLEHDTASTKGLSARSRGSLHRQIITKDVTELGTMAYFLRLKNLLEKSNMMILALGEYGPHVGASIALLREFGYKGDLLVYETKIADPKPDPCEGTWDDLARAIASLSPKKLVVGGQMNRCPAENMSVRRGCIPGFVTDISARLPKDKKTQIIISPVTYPNWWKK